MKYLYYEMLALIRGIMWRWPKFPKMPSYAESSVSVGFQTRKECKDMFKHGWIPYCYSRSKYGPARMFIIKRKADA